MQGQVFSPTSSLVSTNKNSIINFKEKNAYLRPDKIGIVCASNIAFGAIRVFRLDDTIIKRFYDQ